MMDMIKNPKRFLPPRRRTGGPLAQLTREELADAISAFETRGGLIHQLPPQPQIHRSPIGHRWDSMYETVIERV